MNHLSDEVKSTIAITAANGVAATTDINGVTLDMAGFDGLYTEVAFGAITSGAVTSIKLQCGAASDLSDAADVEGTAQTVADTDDGKIFIIDVRHLPGRYARVVVDRGTQNAVVALAIYKQYAAKSLPVSQSSDIDTLEQFVAPQYGTA